MSRRPKLTSEQRHALEHPAWRAFHVPTRPVLRETNAGVLARLLSVNK